MVDKLLNKNFFVKWYKTYGRVFPWRIESLPPFHSLVTEMLLRQTRASGVAKLWQDFVNKYPDAYSLSVASKDELVNQLKVLGFGNQKADALISASNWLVKYHDGQVPGDLDKLLAIPHVGIYAACAVLCFAFNRRIEIVDVNVQRFFARYYGIEVKADVRRNPHIWQIAHQSLPAGFKRAQQHNYGLLDFTAEICIAGKPRCHICPLSSSCNWGAIQLEAENKRG
jgi:A/G-specific adenine glycosylase